MQASLLPQLVGRERDIEILYRIDDGQEACGAKRNALIARARGDYVCFVDDDDTLAPVYVQKLLEGISHSPDCVVFDLIKTVDGGRPRRLKFDLDFSRDTGNYFMVNHLMPIRRSIAQRVDFPPISYGDDQVWYKALRLAGWLRTQHKITNPPLYYYRFQTGGTVCQTSAAVTFSKRYVGQGLKVYLLTNGRLATTHLAPRNALRYLGCVEIN
jgi:glycosyltransferase involved in cell wall biosynthesis